MDISYYDFSHEDGIITISENKKIHDNDIDTEASLNFILQTNLDNLLKEINNDLLVDVIIDDIYDLVQEFIKGKYLNYITSIDLIKLSLSDLNSSYGLYTIKFKGTEKDMQKHLMKLSLYKGGN